MGVLLKESPGSRWGRLTPGAVGEGFSKRWPEVQAEKGKARLVTWPQSSLPGSYQPGARNNQV